MSTSKSVEESSRNRISKNWLKFILPLIITVLGVLLHHRLTPEFPLIHRYHGIREFTRLPETFDIPILTPNLHTRKAAKIKLANGLKVFIVSDPGIIKAGAAVSVETGAWKDPAETPGLGMLTYFTY